MPVITVTDKDSKYQYFVVCLFDNVTFIFLLFGICTAFILSDTACGQKSSHSYTHIIKETMLLCEHSRSALNDPNY